MWVAPLKAKDEVAVAIMRFKAAVEMESGWQLRVLRTDNGSEFTSMEFAEYCPDEGAQRHLTAPYSP